MKPLHLMTHLIDVYRVVDGDVDGAISKTYELSFSKVPCRVDTPTTSATDAYYLRQLSLVLKVFLCDDEVFEDLTVDDRIVFDETNYRVVGKTDLSNLGRVYRIDIEAEG